MIAVAVAVVLATLVLHFISDYRRCGPRLGGATIGAAKRGGSPPLARLLALLGMILTIVGLYGLSSHRQHVSWPRTASSLGLQLLMGILIAYTSFYRVFNFCGQEVVTLLSYASMGGDFVFASYDERGKQTPLAHVDTTMFNLTTTVDKAAVEQAVVTSVEGLPMKGNFAIGVRCRGRDARAVGGHARR